MRQPGDIIFYRVTPRSFIVSKIIAIASLLSGRGPNDSAYSHVAIVAENMLEQYEATWPKTCLSKMYPDKPFEIWRFKQITTEGRHSIIWWCKGNLGQWYDLGQFMLGLADFKHAEICSSFVWKAYHCAGIDLSQRTKKFRFPHELIDDRLERVE